jgi:SAM-dependent methyltransferase
MHSTLSKLVLFSLLQCLLTASTTAFAPSPTRQTHLQYTTLSITQLSAKKSTRKTPSKGFGSPKPAKSTTSSKDILQRVQSKYGGTTPQAIAQGTQKAINEALNELPPHLQLSTRLYRQLQEYKAHQSRLTILQQAQEDPEGPRRAQQELDRLYKEHSFDENDLHNLFQKITWDASADAKALRAVTGKMSDQTLICLRTATKYIADALQANPDSYCLDVGCGYGALVPVLLEAGVQQSRIVGVDLSKEMIRNAQEMHPQCQFIATDFVRDYTSNMRFGAVVFCSSLHDLPDQEAALNKAVDLLQVGGLLVVVHPQGAGHVDSQVQANPVLVKRGLPAASEYEKYSLDCILAPVDSKQEAYLAVYSKK